MNSMIIRNEIKCNHCKQVIISRNRHDYITCECGKVSVDGGIDYLKRNGNKEDYTDLSLVLENNRAYQIGEQPSVRLIDKNK